jgi:soluble lytic murein transglycosylase-like protein
MKMLSELHAEFGEWTLALLAYNAGTELVRTAIRDGRASDAFEAASLGFEHDEGYVARVMAVAIVLKNVQLLGLDKG